MKPRVNITKLKYDRWYALRGLFDTLYVISLAEAVDMDLVFKINIVNNDRDTFSREDKMKQMPWLNTKNRSIHKSGFKKTNMR